MSKKSHKMCDDAVCPHCGGSLDQKSIAESLVDMTNHFMFPKDSLLQAEGNEVNERDFHRFKLGILLKKKPDILLRAIIEDWTLEQIVKGVY